MASKRAFDVVDLTSEDDHPRSKHSRQTGPTELTSTIHRSSNSTIEATRNSWLDASSDVQTSQDFNDFEYETAQLYGTLPSKIVGVQYYTGRATVGEFVVLRREPGNPYDSNAIRIDNVFYQQIGHIPRGVAAKLAPFMDSGSLIIEGTLSGPKGFYDAPVDLKLFGTSDPVASAALKRQMQEKRLPVQGLAEAERERRRKEKEAQKAKDKARKDALKKAANQAGGVRKGGGQLEFEDANGDFANITVSSFDASSDPSMDQILETAVAFNPRELGEVVDKYSAGEEALSKLPLAPQPAGIATKLLPYQRQGLAWMLDRESPQLPRQGSEETTQLWRYNRDATFTNIATNFTSGSPKLASGGILADDMGLGKTIQIISLLLADPHRTKEPTLIVSPLSVMSNWSQQALAHVRPEKKLKILVYHGIGKQGQREQDFKSYDIVVTTYQTLALEYLPGGSKSSPKPVPRSSGLYSINWRRVVLDEGHNIRSPKAKMSQAAYALESTSRWILTGTPIVNSLRDLYSHVKFLRLTGGLEQQDIFSGALIRPLKQGSSDASLLLQALMSTICLRRMKGMKFIDLKLPELRSHRYTVAFEPHEREKYDAFAQEAKGLLIQFQTHKNSKGENTYSHLLEVLLRLRQTCNHWKLCGERAANLLALLERNKKVKLTPDNMRSLQELLQISVDSQEECPICLDTLHTPCITPCAHIFGGECIERVIETQKRCPLCRAELSEKSELVQPAVENAQSEPKFDVETSSSKVEALINILKATRKAKDGSKTVIFSQWTTFLDILQCQLDKNGLKHCRLDGTMSAGKRDEAMQALAEDPECTIMLASLSVCSVGLNLVAANQVILADSWWAPAIEDQAVDRVHRLGQTRPTTVFRLVMEDSIEERVLDIQAEKRKLMMMAFQEKTEKRAEKSARLADIEKLLR